MTIYPFRALRPHKDCVRDVASVPYDVVSVQEAHALAEGNPLSFLHVVRPEIDLPPQTDECDDAVYEKGARNLRRFQEGPHSVREEEPALFLYRLTIGNHSQTGVFGCVSGAEYEAGLIVRHENTRPPKVADRVRHMQAQRAHAEPVILTYPDNRAITRLINESADISEPMYDFVADDNVCHTIWRAPAALAVAFEEVGRFYIADGHHRCEAASRAGLAAGFPAAVFPMSELRILPYNRIVTKSCGTDVVPQITRYCGPVEPSSTAIPLDKGSVCLYARGAWYDLQLPPTRRETIADTLDVALLSEFVLEPVFGITDQRTDPGITFVGGSRGTAALERVPNAIAFSMHPTSIAELVAVSDAGLLMPPKSTWFEPKLRSGLLIHVID